MPVLVFPDPIGVDKNGEPVYTVTVHGPAPPRYYVDRSPPPEVRAHQRTVPVNFQERYDLCHVEGDYAYYEHEDILDVDRQFDQYGRAIYGKSAADYTIGTMSRYNIVPNAGREDMAKYALRLYLEAMAERARKKDKEKE